MTDYINVGPHALDFRDPDLYVKPSLKGTPFSYELDPAREASLIKAGAIALAPKSKPATEEKK